MAESDRQWQRNFLAALQVDQYRGNGKPWEEFWLSAIIFYTTVAKILGLRPACVQAGAKVVKR